MQKIFTILILLLLTASFNAHSQVFTSGFENWTSGKPDNWAGVKTNAATNQYAEYTTNVHGGTKALQLINTTTDHKRFTTQPMTVTAQTQYTITFWTRGKGEVRTGLFDGRPGASSGYADYNSYIIVNTSTWTQQTQSIMAATDTAVAEFILSFRSTVATNDHLQVDDVIITAGAASIDTITIYDIQHTSDASGNSPYTEQLVRTTGVVTGFAAAGYFIQDSTGAWNGIYVYDSGNIVAIGDSISITGKVKEYYNFTELTSITGFVKHASGVALPVPSFIPVSSVKTEAFESVLVSIGNAKCTSVNAGYGMWAVAQGTDSCKVDTSLFKFTPTLNIKYDITAIVNYNFSEFRLSPRSANDIKIATGSDNRPNNQNVVMYPNPVKDMLNIYSENNIKTLEIYNMQGQLVLKEGFSSKQNHINISSLPCGIYCLKLRFENNTSTTSKLLKK